MPYKPNDVTVKILGVSGSPRKGLTDHLTQLALEEAAKVPGVTTEFLPLRTKHIEHCIQCEACLKLTPGEKYEHYCRPFHDDMDELMKYWLQFDGYIVASPVYDMNVTPMLNIFFNRFRPLWRCYRGIHQNKVGGSISIGGTRHGGQETTVAMINNFFLANEIVVTGGPAGNYCGACVWSKDKLPKDFDDPIGVEKVLGIGRRVAEVAKIMKAGREIVGDARPEWEI